MEEKGHRARALIVLPQNLKEPLKEDRWLFEALKAVTPTFVQLTSGEEAQLRAATAAPGRGQLTR